MKFILQHRSESEAILSEGGRKWTYVNDINKATTFPSERKAEQFRDEYCNFPWITIRPYDNSTEKQSPAPEFEGHTNSSQV